MEVAATAARVLTETRQRVMSDSEPTLVCKSLPFRRRRRRRHYHPRPRAATPSSYMYTHRRTFVRARRHCLAVIYDRATLLFPRADDLFNGYKYYSATAMFPNIVYVRI